MPPRYAYWTILIDGKATAFRAREREELLPTFNQLARKNSDIAMRYFARGRLWDNPEQAQWANRNRDARPAERRDRDWRPGGHHKDPRARFGNRGPARTEKAGGTKPPHTKERKARVEARPKDRRPPKFGAPPGKQGGGWKRPPKRDKPR